MKITKNLYLMAAAVLALVSCGQKQAGTVGATSEVESRIEHILGQMTLAEKIGQMNQVSAGGESSSMSSNAWPWRNPAWVFPCWWAGM